MEPRLDQGSNSQEYVFNTETLGIHTRWKPLETLQYWVAAYASKMTGAQSFYLASGWA